jgi:hypothetical protein
MPLIQNQPTLLLVLVKQKTMAPCQLGHEHSLNPAYTCHAGCPASPMGIGQGFVRQCGSTVNVKDCDATHVTWSFGQHICLFISTALTLYIDIDGDLCLM